MKRIGIGFGERRDHVTSLEARQLLATAVDLVVDLATGETSQGVQVTFDQLNQSSLTSSDVTLDLLSVEGDSTVPLATSYSYNATTKTARFYVDYPGGYADKWLPNGNLKVAISAGAVSPTLPETPNKQSYFRYHRADYTRDGLVNFDDLLQIAANYNVSGKVFTQGDSTLDGTVNFDDLLYLAANYNSSLPDILVSPNTLSTGNQTSSTIQVTWTAPDSSTLFDGFRVFRSLDGTNFTQVHETTDVSTRAWNDSGLDAATKYWYRVRSFTIANGNNITTNKDWSVTVLPAPTTISASVVSEAQINVTWNDNSNNETGFDLERSTSSTFSSNIVTFEVPSNPSSSVSFSDTTVVPTTTYYYRVRARRDAINVSATTLPSAAVTTGSPTVSLTATAINDAEVELAWGSLGGSTSYRVDVSLDGYDFTQGSVFTGTDQSATIVALAPGQQVWARVVGLGASGGLEASPPTTNVATTQTAGTASPAAATAGPSYDNGLASRTLVVAFTGAYEPGASRFSPTGNAWMQKMTKDTGRSIRLDDGSYDYKWWRSQALRDVLDEIDTNNDLTISASEASDVRLVITGFSMGAIAAANVAYYLTKDLISYEDTPDVFTFYTLQVDVKVDLLLTLDPVQNAYFGLARLLLRQQGRPSGNVQSLKNWYQDRGGSTTVPLYLPDTTANGTNPLPFTFVGNQAINPPLAGIKGEKLAHNVPLPRVEQVNVNSFGARTPTNVEYFIDPLRSIPEVSGNWYDGLLRADRVQHDVVPFYVRGKNDAEFDPQLNWMREVMSVE